MAQLKSHFSQSNCFSLPKRFGTLWTLVNPWRGFGRIILKSKCLQSPTIICLLQALQLSKKSQQMDYLYLTLCVFNAYLSYNATMLNIAAIYAIRKTSSLPKNFKTLLLSLAVSDLGVGLLAQPMYVAYIIHSQQNNATNDNINVILCISYSGKFLHLCVIV